MEFATLFGDAANGKRKVWSVKVEEKTTGSGAVYGTIITEHGYEDGKKQVSEKDIYEGKNIGRSNETTALEQAISEARNSWQKKRAAGYVPLEGDVAAEEVAANSAIGVNSAPQSERRMQSSRHKAVDQAVPAPMLAHDYCKRGKSIKFPCYVQRKYDGTRCVGVPTSGLFSRNRKQYPHMEHIVADMAALPAEIVLDGELYSDELTFQEIVGLVKRQSLKAGDSEKMKKIKFHVYDIINDEPYEARKVSLDMMFRSFPFRYITAVATEVAAGPEDIKRLHNVYVAEGYEGIMLRNAAGNYSVGQRSADLQKYKEFQDEEYEVIGFKEGEGAEAGCVIWLCKTGTGREFACRPRGTREDRAVLFTDGAGYVGKKLTVRFQELSDEGTPRFPVGIAFRDYE
jgi:DNA ligase-1